MAREIEIEAIKWEIVKPWSPTPEKYRRYELSSQDQYMPTIPVSVLLFYSPTSSTVSQTSQLLIESLSKTLTSFYHFAGRYKDNIAIDCNDEGAGFVAKRINCPLSTILSDPDHFGALEELVPSLTFPKDELSGSPLLIVQANFFNCGGLAIGISITHKIADASTVSTFLSAWASATLKPEIEPTLIPHFISSTSVFPPQDRFLSFAESRKPAGIANEKIKFQSLVFHGPKIEALKLRAATNSAVKNPTRVEAVSALIWKCAIEAISVSKQYTGYSFFHAVNIRKRTIPCLPQNTVGNLLSLLQVKTLSNSEAEKPELEDLIGLLRQGSDELNAAWKTGIPDLASTGPFEAKRQNDGRHKFLASSWCRLPLYGADFGWGRPVWTYIPNMVGAKDRCAISDTEDGEGIEVALWLAEEEMKLFKTNPDLLAFASLNPAVCD